MTYEPPNDDFNNSRSTNQPYISLACAVIIRAILDARGELSGVQENNSHHIQEQAIIWLFDELQPHTPFSFDWCCLTAGLNKSIIRQALKSLPTTIQLKSHFYSQPNIRTFPQPHQQGRTLQKRLLELSSNNIIQ